MTPDGKWIVHNSANPEHPGIFKMRPDGSDPTRIYAGLSVIPEVSADGRWVSFIQRLPDRGLNRVRFVDLDSGELLPVSIDAPIRNRSTGAINLGRSRWTPDGRSIVWIAQDEAGHEGLYIQEFDPARDTSATRRKLLGFDPDRRSETFGISPDGTRLVVSEQELLSTINIAEDLPIP